MEQITREKQDLTYLSWAKIRNSSGTAGSFLKSYSDLGGKKIYYKLSNFDAFKGIIGHECINEIIVDRLLSILGIEHLLYHLIPADKIPHLRPLQQNDKAALFDGLEEILPFEWREKIWEMVWRRWCQYEDFCNQK